MRRSSFVAPLLLIAIGLLFLAHNIYPNLALTDYVGRFWPWILIVWGGLRVAEVMWWQSQGRALPAHGVSGGEWVLAIFLCLLGAGLHTAQGFASSFPGQIQIDGMDFLGEPFQFPVSAEKSTGKAPHILLDNFRGDVKITGIDSGAGGDAVKVSGTKSVRSMGEKDAQRLSDSATVEITGDTNDVVIRAGQRAQVSFHLDISVPKGAQVEIHGQGGDLNVEDVAGATLLSDRGDVRVGNIAGASQITVRRGDLHVEAARVGGQIQVSSGDVDASGVTGPLRISTRSGDVKMRAVTGAVNVDVARGDVELRAGVPLGAVQIHSRSGDIGVTLPADATFHMDAETNRGDVSSDFGELRPDTHGRDGTLKGTVGHGSGTVPTIELRTQRGDVGVRKTTNVVGQNVPEKLDQ